MNQEHLQELIQKYADNKATPHEMQELHDWYQTIHTVDAVEWPAEDPHEKERLREQLLQRVELGIKRAHPEKRILRRIYRMPWIRAAACLIVIASALSIGYLLPRGGSFVSLHNPSGKIQLVRLPDGSKVWLNAASSLRYAEAFAGHRELYLEGEAYFEVGQDKSHPFVVHAGALNTTVLGTAFDIKSFARERTSSVTVIQGKVQVENTGKLISLLTATMQLQWDSLAHKGRTILADTNQVLAWQQGKLRFQGESMKEITACLGRWYGVRFEFTDPAMAQCRYYMNFENTIPLNDLLEAMSAMNNMSYKIDQQDHVVTLSGKGCQ
jgi:ferric-dicitrate binding protein FerR (iron transport regulator)